MHKWYVVQTNPHQEFKAETNLKRQNFDTWLPRYKKTRRHARRVDEVSAPLFPGYLFVRMDVNACKWRSINGTYGVKTLLAQDLNPLALADGFIEDLKQNATEDGFLPTPDPFQKDQNVQIIGGIFNDYIGKIISFNGRERVMILLSLLGREVKATIARKDIVAAT